jgi:hypothetical protein
MGGEGSDLAREQDEYFERLQKGIDRRQAELQRIAGSLSVHARRLTLRASAAKVLLVTLGAFSASKAVADQLFGANSGGSLVVYSLAGILTATIAGLEAAFRWDRRSVDLGVLAALCVAHMREADTMYRSSVFAASPGYEKTEAAAKVLNRQDALLTEVEAASTKAGVNITFELYPPSEALPVSPPPPGPPYPA